MLNLVVAKRKADKLLLDSIGDHLTNLLGLTKERTEGRFSSELLKLQCQSFHRSLASQYLTPLTFAPADDVHIHGIGWRSRSLLALGWRSRRARFRY
jgi:hypothetical protein